MKLMQKILRKVWPVFQGIEIKLSGPICDCDEQNISWSMRLDTTTNRHTLVLTCETCKTALHVPHDKLRAAFVLKTPYPGKPKSAPEIDKPADGNVVQLRPDKSKN